MDRGVKIAIFIASVASLGLGLIWDQVLSNARNAVQVEDSGDMGPEIKEGRIGSLDLKRLDVDSDDGNKITKIIIEDAPSEPVAAKPEAEEWTDYTVQNNDSWWKIANRHFKGRGLSSSDILNANPNVKSLRPGQKIKIPPTKTS